MNKGNIFKRMNGTIHRSPQYKHHQSISHHNLPTLATRRQETTQDRLIISQVQLTEWYMTEKSHISDTPVKRIPGFTRGT